MNFRRILLGLAASMILPSCAGLIPEASSAVSSSESLASGLSSQESSQRTISEETTPDVKTEPASSESQSESISTQASQDEDKTSEWTLGPSAFVSQGASGYPAPYDAMITDDNGNEISARCEDVCKASGQFSVDSYIQVRKETGLIQFRNSLCGEMTLRFYKKFSYDGTDVTWQPSYYCTESYGDELDADSTLEYQTLSVENDDIVVLKFNLDGYFTIANTGIYAGYILDFAFSGVTR